MVTTAQFENILPWLMPNCQSLDVLVHPLTDNSYDDHSHYVVWLGSPVPLKLNTMSRTYRAEQYPRPPRARPRGRGRRVFVGGGEPSETHRRSPKPPSSFSAPPAQCSG